MAHVLLGWELGAGRGHALRLHQFSNALRGAGHRVSIAVQRLDCFGPAWPEGVDVWQAPVTPRLLVSTARAASGPLAGMADILARLGMDDAGLVAAVIRGWDRLLAAIRPDLLVSDFAPFLQLAARGRLPVIAAGAGFSVPPCSMDAFPALIEGGRGVDQARLLASVNAALLATDRAPLDAAPGIWTATRALVATFAELDPYAGHRDGAYFQPVEAGFDARAGDGEEVFVYGSERVPVDGAIWQGLARSGLKVRLHVPRATAPARERWRALGLIVEPAPVPFATIARRSRLVASHGGHGFVCAAMLAGLPQVVFHYDLEKLIHGRAIAREGLGGHVALSALDPARFGADLARLHRDESLAARARAAGERLRSRNQRPLEQGLVEAVAALA